jgi:hypothetical protein
VKNIDCIIIVKKNWFDDPRMNCTWHNDLNFFDFEQKHDLLEKKNA